MLNETNGGGGLSIADAMALKDNNNGGFFGGDVHRHTPSF